ASRSRRAWRCLCSSKQASSPARGAPCSARSASPVSDDVEPAAEVEVAPVQTLIPTVIGLGLAIAVCSPVSVVTIIVLLTMPSGRRRGIAFVVGWLLAIAVIAVVVVGLA